MAKDNLAKQLNKFMDNYRKTQENAKVSEEVLNSIKRTVFGDNWQAQEYNSNPRSMNNRVNTIIGAIRDNALTKEGMRGLAGDYRFNQVKEALSPRTGNVEERTTTVNIPEESITATIYPDGSRSRSVGMDANGTVYFKYVAGDTLGDVIKELGLQTDKGLWGPDGDVEYYTKQLREQGINGNIPTDRVIKLQKRK